MPWEPIEIIKVVELHSTHKDKNTPQHTFGLPTGQFHASIVVVIVIVAGGRDYAGNNIANHPPRVRRRSNSLRLRVRRRSSSSSHSHSSDDDDDDDDDDDVGR